MHTATFTDTVPTPYYAACGPSNLISAANGGHGILAIGSDAAYNTVQGVSNAYDCCVYCQKTANCAGTIFSRTCYAMVDTKCSAGQVKGRFYTDPGTTDGFTVSNGPCGIIENAGDPERV